jgi:hypothetical protein
MVFDAKALLVVSAGALITAAIKRRDLCDMGNSLVWVK